MDVSLSEMRVGFHGEGAGAGELTWGQLGIWQAAQLNRRTMNLVWPMRLPRGVSLAEVTEALGLVVGRYPALRTRLQFPDGSRPRQVIAESGEVPLHVADIGDGDDPDAAAEELRSRYELAYFDYEHEFPIRMGVVRQAGVLSRLVVGFSHVMLDGGGVNLIFNYLKRLGHSVKPPLSPPGLNPLELARRQGTPELRRQSERAVRYWRTQLDSLPAWQPKEPTRPREPRFNELVMYSAAMELGMRVVKARTGAGDTAILLATYSTAVARVLRRNPNAVRLVVSNRFRAELSGMVSQVSQHGICVIDTAGAKFDEVVARAHGATTNASRHAYYDPEACDELIDEITASRGAPLHVSWCLNDRRVLSRIADRREVATRERVTESLRQSKLYWDFEAATSDAPLIIHVDSDPIPPSRRTLAQGSSLPAAYLIFWTDTHQFERDDMEALAREMERVAVAAAFD